MPPVLADGLKQARGMRRFKLLSPLFVLLLVTPLLADDWQPIVPGVDYQEFRENNYDIHVTRVDLNNDAIRVVVSRENEKGLKVSDYAKKNNAIAAINGDYFDDHFTPIGLTIGPCGKWTTAKDAPREAVVTIAQAQATIRRRTELPPDGGDGVDAAISGWPAIVNSCRALSPSELPGSDSFTRSPHPRTALGVSSDGRTLYFVVADGRRTGVPGLTLAQLGSFMADRLKVCSAINLDGGGSSAMWVTDRVVNRPSDGSERPVGDAIAVMFRKDVGDCDATSERSSPKRAVAAAAAAVVPK